MSLRSSPRALPLLPLGALAAGFGLAPLASAQVPAPSMPAPAASAPVPDADPADPDTVMPVVRARAAAEAAGRDTLRATTTRIGRGEAELRDVPQSITVVTEKLIDDRQLETMKEALRNTAGISFQAAEGGEEDIRLRGFSLQSTGDIFIDGQRDPAFYERDSFNWDRLEVLRGSASMLFGRGSTGGAVNQVSKQPHLGDAGEVAATLGSRGSARATVDLNRRLGETSALRVNAMAQVADGDGLPIDRRGIAPSLRLGIGTDHDLTLSLYHLRNDNGIHYGLPWLTPGALGGDFLWPTDPAHYYGAASDFNRTGTDQASAVHLMRLGEGRGEVRTALRAARYLRDQRASAIRFRCRLGFDGTLPEGCDEAVDADTFSADTVLTRGTQNKKMQLRSLTLQSEYSGDALLWGARHALQAGVDLTRDQFANFAFSLPEGVVLTKPDTTVGTPDDGTGVDESLRIATRDRRFTMRSLGLYVQDMLHLNAHWKLLGGLRHDRLDGEFRRDVAAAAGPGGANPCATAVATAYQRDDALWSRRAGVLYQPDGQQSWHLSYGTSFNTSGDAYQFDAGTVNTPPEKSRNLELGGRYESEDGAFSTRVALFHTTKYNERNRDAESVDACNYVLSGERHAAGFEIDLAGRLSPRWEVYGSYAWIPVARVDQSSGAQGTEAVGSRPGLTPRHSGTIWTTYQLDERWRVGGGLNARSADRPVGLAVTSPIVAPAWVTADLMAEYALGAMSFKLNLTNVTNRHYADVLYRGHYVPGKPRTLQATVAYRF